ncbi:MAG: hypothetical protein KDA77_00285 [Planctomycetaceae bacterium]|nr:hypothetical protein [Planctomycetaceae bacterium]
MFEPLVMYTVYGPGTSDLPGVFVCRKHMAHAGVSVATPEHWAGKSLEEVREQIPDGLHCLPRFREDDPNIIEVWL